MNDKPDIRRADNCDCDDGNLPPGWTCGKPECHRTKIANAALKSAGRSLLKMLKKPDTKE